MKRHLLSTAIVLAATPLVALLVAFVLMWSVHQWNLPAWVVILAGGGLSAAAMYGVWRIVRRLVRDRFRFSIRAMLIGVAIVAALLATVGRWWVDFFGQHSAIRSVSMRGAYVDDGRGDLGRPKNLMFDWIGYDPFERDRILELDTDRALEEVLDGPGRFSNFVMLSFNRGVTSAGFARAERLNQLTDVRVGQFLRSSIDDQGLQRLSQWTNVEYLFFNSCPYVTDAGLAHLVDLPNLDQFALIEEGAGMVITDAGLVHVGKMKNLKLLMLRGLLLTDTGLPHLYGLTNLQELSIRDTGITEDGMRQLYAALPDCRINSDVAVSGSANVKRIVVHKLDHPQTMVPDVTEPERIADVLSLIEAIKPQDAWDSRVDEPWPAEYRLEFVGKSRTLFEVRLGERELQQSFAFFRRWTKWRITDEQQSRLLGILKPTGVE
jgi:hypothetical protein